LFIFLTLGIYTTESDKTKTKNIVKIITFLGHTMSTLKAESEPPAVARWVKMAIEISV